MRRHLLEVVPHADVRHAQTLDRAALRGRALLRHGEGHVLFVGQMVEQQLPVVAEVRLRGVEPALGQRLRGLLRERVELVGALAPGFDRLGRLVRASFGDAPPCWRGSYPMAKLPGRCGDPSPSLRARLRARVRVARRAPPEVALAWHDAAATSQCAELRVPIDHGARGGASSSCASRVCPREAGRAHRRAVRESRRPGISAVEHLRGSWPRLGRRSRRRFDLVAFDTRGTGASAPLDCHESLAALLAQDPAPADDRSGRARSTRAARSPTSARASTGVLPFMSSADSARDMDGCARRSARRDLDLGFSYGTALGASYATCSPSACARWCSTARSMPTFDLGALRQRAGGRGRGRARGPTTPKPREGWTASRSSTRSTRARRTRARVVYAVGRGARVPPGRLARLARRARAPRRTATEPDRRPRAALLRRAPRRHARALGRGAARDPVRGQTPFGVGGRVPRRAARSSAVSRTRRGEPARPTCPAPSARARARARGEPGRGRRRSWCSRPRRPAHSARLGERSPRASLRGALDVASRAHTARAAATRASTSCREILVASRAAGADHCPERGKLACTS